MRSRALGLFCLLAVIWGTAFTAIKAGLASLPPVLFAALRFDIAGVVMVAYVIVGTDRWRPRTAGEWGQVATGAVLLIAAYHALLFVGEQGTTAAVAAVIVALSPILTTAFARLLLSGRRLSIAGLAGLAVGFTGVVVLSDPNPSSFLGGGAHSELLVLGAAAAFALGGVLTEALPGDLPIETLEAWSMVGGAVLLHGASVAMGEAVADAAWTPTAIVALGYLSLVASAGGFLLYFDLLERLGAVEINLVSYATPIAAAATALLVLGERPTVGTAAGFALILVGFVLVKRHAIAAEWARRRTVRE